MKLLIFAHGRNCAVQSMLDGFGGDSRKKTSSPNPLGIECYHVNARASEEPEDDGVFGAGEFLLTLFFCLQAVWCRFRHGVKNFYYIPAPGNRAALCRDWLVMLVCRPFFERVIFHWRNAGLAKWLETSAQIRTRSFTYRLMKDASLSIAPLATGRRDAEKLLPVRLVTLADDDADFAAQLAVCLRKLENPEHGNLKLALTILAENPSRKTGLSSMFHELVSRSLALFPDVSWVVFAGPNQDWQVNDPRVEVVRDFPANDRLNRRLFADHFRVPAAARARGAQFLLTVGFVPLRKQLPTARMLGIEQDVLFPGWVDDSMIAPLYRHAAAFCLPSREETFGRSVIEAMACGTPCIVNDIPIMHEVTAGHALIIDYHDPAAVSLALQKLIADDQLINRLRADGIARAQEFTFEKLATERVTAIRQLAKAIHRVE
jgi:hypothetical protein